MSELFPASPASKASPRGRLVLLGVIVLVLLSPWSKATADPITGDQALAAVQRWLGLNPKRFGAEVERAAKGVTAYPGADGQTAYYIVVLSPAGFVVVAADDLVEPIVAFSAGGRFTASLTHPMGSLVVRDMTSRTIQARRRAMGAASVLGRGAEAEFRRARAKWLELLDTSDDRAKRLPLVSDPRVEPLITSRWDQENVGLPTDPHPCYNYYTPNRYPCGCVATAMAQLIRHYSHVLPVTGVGVQQFLISIDGLPRFRNLRGGDGNGGMYLWSLMTLVPDRYTSETQRAAIGALTHDAGVSVGMAYTEVWAGADTLDAAESLTDVFGYPNAMAGWNGGAEIRSDVRNRMVNPNLDSRRPVLLGIARRAGSQILDGHCVVCDGYGYETATLYHHLNMGWSGYDDLWYNLPTISSLVEFNTVRKIIYNVYTSGTGELVSGRVVNDLGQPLALVTVMIRSTIGSPVSHLDVARTNSVGIFAFSNVPSSGEFTVSASLPPYTFTDQTITTDLSVTLIQRTGNVWGVDFQGIADRSVLVNPSTLNVPEGNTDTFDVTLSFPPTVPLTVLTARTAGDVDISVSAGGSLTFSDTNYNIPQQVTVAAAQDVDMADGIATLTCSATGYTSATVVVSEVDDDLPPIETSVPTVNVPEGGTAGFGVRLGTAPTGVVSLQVAYLSGDTDISVSAGATLLFSPTDYDVFQAVTLTAAQDLDSVDGSAIIRCRSTGWQSADVTATETDDDPAAILTDVSALTVPEGSTANFQVKLTEPPATAVSVTIAAAAGGDADITVLTGAQLTFDDTSWSKYQLVTLQAAVDVDDIHGVRTFTATTAGYDPAQVVATERDSDAKEILADVATVTVSENGKAAFYVRLSRAPASALGVFVSRVSGSDSDIVVSTASPLKFTASNWGKDQRVVLTAVDDVDALHGTATITCRATGWKTADVIATEADDDLAIVTNVATLSVPEGGKAGLYVSLHGQPAVGMNVSVNRISGDTDIMISSGSLLTFTPADWNVPQLVVLSAQEDKDLTDSQATIRCSATGWQSADVVATEDDNDSPGGAWVNLRTTIVQTATTLYAGDNLPVSYSVFNEGNVPGASVSVGLYLGLTGTKPRQIGSHNIGTVASRQTVSGAFLTHVDAPTERGAYTVVVFADYNDRIAEPVEVDNIDTASVFIENDYIDLAVSDPELTLGNMPVLAIGQYARGEARLGNQGSKDGWEFYLHMFLTPDQKVQPELDVNVRSTYVPRARAGITATVSSDWFFVPTGTKPGSYYVGAYADLKDRVKEYDETNNTAVSDSQVTVTIPQADLVPSSPAVASDQNYEVFVGEIHVFGGVMLTNAWNHHSGMALVHFFLSTDNDIDPLVDTNLGYTYSENVARFASQYLSTNTLSVPRDMLMGDYWVGALADMDDRVAEYDETNNTALGATLVSVVAMDSDFSPVSLQALSSARIGASLTLSDATANRGRRDGQCLTYYYISDNPDPADPNATMTYVGSCVRRIVAGSVSSERVRVWIPNSLTEGHYYLVASADRFNHVRELDETNNVIVTPLALGLAAQEAAALAKPVLVSPVGTVSSSQVTFEWQAVLGAQAYELWAASDRARTNPVLVKRGLTDNRVAQVLDLPGGDYVWWVSASAPGMTPSWSAPGEFTLAEETIEALAAPEPVAPKGRVGRGPVVFTWSEAPGALGYDLCLLADGSALPVCGTTQVTQPQLVLRKGLTKGSYSWFVRARVAGQAGPWSRAAAFTVE